MVKQAEDDGMPRHTDESLQELLDEVANYKEA